MPRLVVASLALLAVAGITHGIPPEPPKMEKLTGMIELPKDAKLDADAVIVIALQDTSKADVAAVKIASQTIKDAKESPIKFAIEYDPAQIMPKNRYTLSARITVKDKLAFINDTSIPVLTNNAPNKDVKVPVIAVKR